MKEAVELYKLLQGIGKRNIGVVSIAEVLQVDKNKCTCTVNIDGLDIADVRLKSTADNKRGFKIFPAIGSDVLIECIDNGEYVVQMMGEVESVVLEIDNKKIEIDKAGIFIGNDNSSLLKVIELIIDAVMKVVVLQGQNPDYKKLIEAKSKIKTFLK